MTKKQLINLIEHIRKNVADNFGYEHTWDIKEKPDKTNFDIKPIIDMYSNMLGGSKE